MISNEIIFNWMKCQNFFSIGKEVTFDFSKHSGMNYIFGVNKDVDIKNGCGKCLTDDTEIVVSCTYNILNKFKSVTSDVRIIDSSGTITESFEDINKEKEDKTPYAKSAKSLNNAKNMEDEELIDIEKQIKNKKEQERIIEFITHIGSVVGFYKLTPFRDLKVLTPFGFKTILDAKYIETDQPMYLKTYSGKELTCSPNHRVKSRKHFRFVKDLLQGDFVDTFKGQEKVRILKYLNKKVKLYDIQVAEVEQYYSNGILSHNSTLFVDAPLFALFNKTAKKVNKPSIPNRLDKKNSYVHINFNIGSDNFEIQSGITPNYFKLFKNNTNISKPSPKETLEYVEREILKSSFLLFKYNIILSVSDTKNIFNMSKEERRRFIDSLFNLLVVGKMYKNIKKDLNTLDKELLLEQNMNKKLNEDILTFSNRLKDFDAEQKQICIKILEDIKIMQNNLKELIVEEVDNSKIDKIEKSIKELLTQSENISDKLNKLQKNVYLLENDNANKQKAIDKYKNILDIICKDCYTKVDNMIGLTELITTQNTNKEKIEKINAGITLLNSNKDALRQQKNNLEIELNNIEKKIKDIEQIKTKRFNIENKIRESMEKVMTEKSKKSPFISLLDDYKKKLEISDSKLDEFVSNRKYLDFLIFATSEEGIKKCLIADMVNILNEKIKLYLEEMGCEYTALFDPNFDCTFLSTTGECEYDNFSSGEKRRIDVAITFAFKDLLYMKGLLKSNILVCDEILDSSIDEFAINAIIKLLKNMSKTQTIYLISHREAVDSSDFDNIIELQKLNGVTTIVNDDQGEV